MYFSPRRFKFLLNLYPPYLGAGIRIKHISKDWMRINVSMKLRWYNRNAVGSHFGGSLYSMVDPHLMLMLMQLLGRDYVVWDQSACIDYISAAKTEVTAEICLEDADITKIREKTKSGDKYLGSFNILVKDTQGGTVAKIKKILYIRKKSVSPK